MLGYDFGNLWETGRLILQGLSPYANPITVYPPIANYLFSILGLLPFTPAFALWTGVNVILYLNALKRLNINKYKLVWFAFAPTVFILLTGQTDIILFWLSTFLSSGGWVSIITAALVTLKPQFAFIVLPWFLIRWLRFKTHLFWRWLIITTLIHTIPLLIRSDVYTLWFNLLKDQGWRILSSPGIFSLTTFNVPLAFLGVIALISIIWGLFQNNNSSKAAQLFGLPSGMWYQGVALVGTAPWWIMVPVSWFLFFLANLFKNAVPLAGLPLIPISLYTIARFSHIVYNTKHSGG